MSIKRENIYIYFFFKRQMGVLELRNRITEKVTIGTQQIGDHRENQ